MQNYLAPISSISSSVAPSSSANVPSASTSIKLMPNKAHQFIARNLFEQFRTSNDFLSMVDYFDNLDGGTSIGNILFLGTYLNNLELAMTFY